MSTAKKVITSGSIPRRSGSGSAGMRSKTVAMKTLLAENGGGTIMDGAGEAGEQMKFAMLQKLSETDDHGPGATASVTGDMEKEIIVEQMGGKTPSQIAVEYGVHRDFVNNALRRRFGSAEKAKAALLGLCLENALALQEVVASKIGEFSGPQAVMSSAILTDKALAIEKSIQETPKTIDFGALRSIGSSLARLRSIVPKKAEVSERHYSP